MQLLKLDRPDSKYEEYIDELLSLNYEDDVNLVYDLKFMTPFIGVLISSFLNTQKFKIISKIGSVGKTSEGYAENSNFFHFLKNDADFNERNTSFSESYTPIMKVMLDNYRRGSDNAVEKVSEKIANVLSCGNSGVRTTFLYLISELIRNIPEHSHQFDAWYCAQSWTHNEYIEAEFALIDYGIGYRESLNFKGTRNVSDDLEALKLAIKPGVTSGIIDKSHLREGEEAEYLNSGYGLFVVTELCKRLQGHYVILSKGAIATKKTIKAVNGNKIFPGTAIKIKLQVPQKMSTSDFEALLKDIIENGELESKTVDGAINKASTKSKSINYIAKENP